MRISLSCSRPVVLLAAILISISALAEPGPDFTLAVLPDTQFYSEAHPDILTKQIDWIVANRAKLGITYVAHLGDITNKGDEKPQQWANASSALYPLENPAITGLPAGIPYGVVPGNHDHKGGDSQFEKHFGVAHFESRHHYGGHQGTTNNNHYDLFTAGGMEFIVVYIDFNYDKLDYAPIDAWADGVLKANPKRRAIVVSHDLLAVKGSFDPRGQAIYDSLKGNPNLFLMLCGHNHGEARRFDTYEGRTVLTLLSDYQAMSEGGGGYLRLLRFSPRTNIVQVQTYSPWLDRYDTDAGSQFEFGYRMDGPLGGLGVAPVEPAVVPGEVLVKPKKP